MEQTFMVELTETELKALAAFKECVTQLASEEDLLEKGQEVKAIFDGAGSAWEKLLALAEAL